MDDPRDRAAVAELARAFGGTIVDGPGDVLVSDEWTAEHDPRLIAGRSRGCRVATLAGLIIARHDGPWVGITGTAGKSSACHALAQILRACGREVRMSTSARSGNAWPDWSLARDEPPPEAVLVAELTSSHLCHMDTPLAPDVAVVTLIRPDHPDLHPTNAAYIAAKARLLPPRGTPGAIVLPCDDPETLAVLPAGTTADLCFGGPPGDDPGAYRRGDGEVALITHREVALARLDGGPATHVRAALAAAAAALGLGLDPGPVAGALAALPHPPHRQHMVGRFRGAWVLDDTLAATPRKVLAAVEEYGARDPVFVLGGAPAAHPDGDVERALESIGRRGLRVVTFGEMAARIAAALPVVASAPTVMGALAMAATLAGPGGLVVVSPMFAMPPAERERVAALPEA